VETGYNRVMSAHFVNIDRRTPMLFPPDLKEWLPEDSMVYFVTDAVEQLDINGFCVNERGTGSEQYPPAMMLTLLVYCYATGRFSSREIERATYNDVAVRYICGGTRHPDHDTICTFRVVNKAAFREAFGKILMLARELGCLKKVGGVSVDGTKIKANASKHAAVSYKRSGEMIEQLELEIDELMHKAEEADKNPLEDGLTIPGEIARRKERKEALEKARQVIEERYKEARQEKQAGYDEKKRNRDEQRKEGKKPRGREPEPPAEKPDDKNQFNFTDPESRIMRAGTKDHFEQAFNAQAVVDTEGSMLVLGQRVTTHVNDKEELAADVNCVSEDVREIRDASADTGYFSEKAVTAVEKEGRGPKVYCAVERQSHHRTIADILKKEEPEEPGADASVKEKMLRRLKTQEGKRIYKKRKETVEPVFGIIKSVMGFRQFLLRGLDKVSIEWNLVTLSYNVKRLYRMSGTAAF
jgi:transposase